MVEYTYFDNLNIWLQLEMTLQNCNTGPTVLSLLPPAPKARNRMKMHQVIRKH